MKLLFTSVGRRVELIQAFQKAGCDLKCPLTIYGADMTTDAPALFYCDRQLQICRISDKQYIPSLLEICRQEHIDALIPTIDTDLLILSKNKQKFAEIGTKVIVSAEDKITICRDKRFTSDFFIKCGLKAPLPVNDVSAYNMGFPCFIKPRDGSSSINAYRANTLEELNQYATQVPDYIIQPFIEGEEYTIDIFCDFDGKPIYITPRKRLAVRSGEVLKTEIDLDQTIIEECQALIRHFQPVGAITVQLIRQSGTNENYYIEINPRFGGGAPLSIKAGADSARALLRLLNNENLEYLPDAAFHGQIYSRFDQSVCVNPKRYQAKVILFDLDDTLYNEIDYVRSGFHKVADFLRNKIDTRQAYETMINAFSEGKPAINYLLDSYNLTEPDLLKNCLEIYRNQLPDIQLCDEIRQLLISLRNKGLKTGIITDGRPEGQHAKIEALNLQNLVDEIIITDELGGPAFRKPNSIAFQIMKYRFDVEYGEMIYIGDNPKKDFCAPKELGMKYLWYDNPEGLYRYRATGNECACWKEIEKYLLALD